MRVESVICGSGIALRRRRGVSSRLMWVGCEAIVIASLATMAARAAGDGCCCAHCGCDRPCQKVCRLVCEEKKVEIICWGCKCEDFCLPGPSEPGCKHCELVCGECPEKCDGKTPHAVPKRFVWFDWSPCRCATLHTKTKLMQKKVSKTVPSYKWVVEDLCAGCESSCDCATVVTGAEVPPPPATDAKIMVGDARAAIAQPAR